MSRKKIYSLLYKLITAPRDFIKHCQPNLPPQSQAAQIIAQLDELDQKYGHAPLLETNIEHANFEKVVTRLELNLMKLSERQLYMLYLLNAGLQDKEIASEMSIQPNSVSALKEEVRKKWDVNTNQVVAIFEREVTALVMAAQWIRRSPNINPQDVVEIVRATLSHRTLKKDVKTPTLGILTGLCVFLFLAFSSNTTNTLHPSSLDIASNTHHIALSAVNAPQQVVAHQVTRLSASAFLAVNTNLPNITQDQPNQPENVEQIKGHRQNGCLSNTEQRLACNLF